MKIRWGTAWAVSFAVFLKGLLTPISDPDLWWHLASGREMVIHHLFLRSDIFSHTRFGAPWINFEWLSQILMFLLVSAGGSPAMYAAKIFFSLTALLLLILACRRAGARGGLLLALAWVGYAVLRPRLSERPELATLNFLPIFVLMLMRARTRPGARGLWSVWAGLLMVVWCNLHAGFVVGLGVTVLFALGSRWAKDDKAAIRFFDRTALACALATLINPYGARLFVVFYEHLVQLRGGASLIQEWRPSEVSTLPYFWALFLVGAALMVRAIMKRDVSARFWIPAVVAFSVWGGLMYRNSVLLAFIGLPFAGQALSRLRLKQSWLWAVGLACFLPLARADSSLLAPIPKSAVNWGRFPVAACEYVQKKNIQGRMFNSYDHGGFIEWKLGPERAVFMDGRYLFQPLLLELESVGVGSSEEQVRKNWQRYFSKYGVDYAIVGRPRQPEYLVNIMFPKPRWSLVFEDAFTLVFRKRT